MKSEALYPCQEGMETQWTCIDYQDRYCIFIGRIYVLSAIVTGDKV